MKNNNTSIVIRFFMRPIFVSFVALIFASDGFSQRAETVWVEAANGSNSIVLSELRDDEWSAPAIIYSTENPISRPSMATLPENSKLMIWSEQQLLRSVLMMARKDAASDVWQEPQLFSDFGKENTGVSVLVDLNGQLWVFWAANKTGLDDVYYVQERGGSWSEPRLINQPNDVPDHLPMATNLTNGDVQLDWLSFNFVSSSYLTQTKVFKLDVPAVHQLDSDAIEKELTLADVSLPSGLDPLAPAILHYPNNRLVQTIVLGASKL